MAPAHIPVFSPQKASTKNGINRAAILFLAWVPSSLGDCSFEKYAEYYYALPLKTVLQGSVVPSMFKSFSTHAWSPPNTTKGGWGGVVSHVEGVLAQHVAQGFERELLVGQLHCPAKPRPSAYVVMA